MCLPFCHNYEVRGSHQISLNTEFKRGPATYVLQVCKKCGKLKQKYVWGVWSTEQLVSRTEKKQIE